MLVEKFEGADSKDLHLQPAGVRLPRPAAEQAPRADALRAEERQGPPAGRGRAAVRQGPHLHRRRWRGRRRHRRRSSAKTGASSRPWTTRCGSTWASPRTSSSSARSTRTKRKRVTGNLFDQEVIVKYEIENFKKQPVTLDVVENLRHVRNEVRGDTGRDVEWELGRRHDVRRRPRRRTQHVRASSCSTSSCRPPTPTARPRRSIHKLHLILEERVVTSMKLLVSIRCWHCRRWRAVA